ncbi:DUF2442 domain-containing protein [Vibrio harveyi]
MYFHKELLYYVELSSGSKGIVNFHSFCAKYPDFKQIKGENKDEQYYLDGYSIKWYNGADIAPAWVESQLASTTEKSSFTHYLHHSTCFL